MKTFNCILGVFSILGAVYCMVFPGATFLSSSIIVAILLGVMGLCSIFEFVSNKDRKAENGRKGLAVSGVLELILGIGAAVVTVLAVFSARVRLILDLLILVMFVFWLVYSGVTGIFGAIAQKKLGTKLWVLSLIMSIVLIITGLFAASHLVYAAFAIGYMIGIGLLVYGVRLIMSVFEDKE